MQKDLDSIIDIQKEEALKFITSYEIELEKIKELLAQRRRSINSLEKERDNIQRVLEGPKKRLSELGG